MFNKSILILTVFAVMTYSAFAGVNLKNGNFYVTYTDIEVPGAGKTLKIERTYNSKATTVGWFGFGWGSDFETYLVPSADGSVVIHENGAGGKTRFTPKAEIDPTKAAERVVDAMRKKSTITDKAASDLIKRLKENADLRHAYAKNFGVTTKIAEGTFLYSNERGHQKIKKLKSGFARQFSNGDLQIFDKDGKLVKMTHQNGYDITFSYKKGKLFSIKDTAAKQLFFDWYADGRVKSVWSAGDKKVEYKYDKNNNLVYAKDIDGNVYKYTFDQNHNLEEITYSDKSTYKISYEPKTLFVSEIVDRSGDKVSYKYGSDPKNADDHYWTTVTKTGFDGKPVSNRYEYEIKGRPDGSKYTYRILTEINGIKTETIYSECCSLPLKIARGKHITNFEYNKDGLLTKKSSTKGDFVQIDYDDKHRKIKKVVNNSGWTKFDYDKKGNLIKALNSSGKAVLLVYDLDGKISKMVDHDKKTKKRRTLAFKYNALKKPVVIEMEKIGKISVAYDNYGNIKKVESKQGHKMALQVTQAFQNLLTIVKPAGVNLNM